MLRLRNQIATWPGLAPPGKLFSRKNTGGRGNENDMRKHVTMCGEWIVKLYVELPSVK